MDLTIRPRRLRGSDTLRRMVRETRVSPDSLIYPLFLIEGENIKEPIPSLEGQWRYSPVLKGLTFAEIGGDIDQI